MALVQLIIARRGPEWALLRGGHQMGAYPTLVDADAVAVMMAQQIRLQDDDCEILIQDDEWRDEACPEGQGAPA